MSTTLAAEQIKLAEEMKKTLGKVSAGLNAPKLKAIKSKDFDLGFDLTSTWITDGVRRMHGESQRILADMTEARFSAKKGAGRWLTLCGRSGCGKTYLARAIIKHAEEHMQARSAQCWLWSRVMDKMLSGCWDLMDQLKRMPVLAIDDIGADGMNKLYVPKLYELLEARLGKWTILTSNMTISEISDKLDARIASRCFRGGSMVVSTRDAKDYCLEQFKRQS